MNRIDTDILEEPKVIYDLKERTKKFALDGIIFAASLPKHGTGKIFAHQLVRAATSVGANYRAAALAQSKASFIAKLSIAPEEVDETEYWLELIRGAEIQTGDGLNDLITEADELTRILAASRIRARLNSEK